MHTTGEELAALRPLRAVPAAEIEALLALGEERLLAQGEVLIEVDQRPAHAMLLVHGRLGAHSGARLVGDIWPGEIVGESALDGAGHPSQVRVVAMAQSTVLVLTPQLLEAAAGTPALAALQVHLVHALSRRIRSSNLAIRRAWQEHQAPARPAAAPPEPSLLDRLRALLGMS